MGARAVTILLVLLLSFSCTFHCVAQTVEPSVAKPKIIVEQEAGKTLAHLTIPGTNVRDYTKPSFILEKSGDTFIAYPTLAGTSVRDYTKAPITFNSNKSEGASPAISQSSLTEQRTLNNVEKSRPSDLQLGESFEPNRSPMEKHVQIATSPQVTLPSIPKLETPTPRNNGSSVLGSLNANPYSPNSLANPYGAGSPYKADGLLNPYSQYGSPYSPNSWNNPYATETPRIVDRNGNYRGKLSSNPYEPDSVSNPYGRYGNPYSPDSLNNPYGAGNPYLTTPIYVVKPKR